MPNRTKPKSTQTAEFSSSQKMTEKGKFYQRFFSLNHLPGGPKSSLTPTHKGDKIHEPKFLEGLASLWVEREMVQNSHPLLWLRIGCVVR